MPACIRIALCSNAIILEEVRVLDFDVPVKAAINI